MKLAAETPEDWWEVEALYDLCFAPGREALSSYRLRDGVEPVPGLALVARDPLGILAAQRDRDEHVRAWAVRLRSCWGRWRCIPPIRAKVWAVF